MGVLRTIKDFAASRKTTSAEDVSVKPVQRRLLVPLAAVLLLLVGGFAAVMLTVQQKHLKQSSWDKLEAVTYDLKGFLKKQSEMLFALEDVLLHETGLTDALKAQDRDRLLADYEPLLAQLRARHGITHLYFQRPDRVNLLRVHNPGKSGDLIDRFTTLEAERTGQMASGIELGPLGTFTLRVVWPVFDGKILIGYLELGKEIEDVLEDISEEHGIELAAYIHKKMLDQTQWEAGMVMLGREANWGRYNKKVLIYHSQPRFPSEFDHFIEGQGHVHGNVTGETAFNGKSWRVMLHPLKDVSGTDVGDLIIMHDISEAKAAFHRLFIASSLAALVLLGSLLEFLHVLLRRTDRGICLQYAEIEKAKETALSMMHEANIARKETEEINEDLEIATARAEAANIAKSQFLANMSHEIRTPMNAIIGFSDILATEELTTEQKQEVNLIRDAGHNLLNIINDILDFSKIETGKLEVAPADCSLKKILNGIDAMMRPLAEKKGLQFEIIRSESLPAIIQTDNNRLHQCLVNLINNAIKFTDQGHVHVKVSVENFGAKSFIRFDVDDTGIGIPPDMQEHIFESFTQEEKGSTRQYGGTGLGLTITNQLAGLLGGKVSLTSVEGIGSTFSLSIPAGVHLTSQPLLGKAVRETIPTKASVHMYSGKVLVADDDEGCQVLATRLFESLGLEVTIAKDGKEAVEKTLEGGPFDLIFMDIRMPHLDGFQAAEALHEKGITIPIIALTAHAMEGDKELCLEAGCDDYISKPIDRKELLQILDKYLTVKSEQKRCRPKRHKVIQS